MCKQLMCLYTTVKMYYCISARSLNNIDVLVHDGPKIDIHVHDGQTNDMLIQGGQTLMC